MAFGLLKHFKDIKKNNSVELKELHSKHVIIGHDLGAILKFIELKKNFPDEQIKIVTPRLISKADLVENYELGVSQIRSEVAVQNILRKHFDIKIISQKDSAHFYKDGKFHEFGGRAKSMDLLAGEEFFIQKGHRIKVASLFPIDIWEKLDDLIKAATEIKIISTVEKTTPQDLVNKDEWKITFRDFTTLTAENLYVSESPRNFLNSLTHKESLTPELIDLCSSVKIQSAISVSWILKKELYSSERTLFVPQSMTHEWGHFILEFENFDYAQNHQVVHGLFLIHEDEPQTEDLAGKIKLMKRVIDRVFPHFEESISKEFIRFDNEMFISDFKDDLVHALSFDYPTLKFVSQNTPMVAELAQEKFLARTLLN